ncbi:MAG TPA: carboxypeptidase-like regulatory domain-containing protein [Candidatus Polarisedimenticolia bacterium]|nr:carboxypeptidase-like regulatory domain-containing protein [Candidatus Polarisedimenticolia bacterium]
MKLVALFLLTALSGAQCDKAVWVVDDDGIAGGVSTEGKPVKHAIVHLSSQDREYTAITDEEGGFSIWPVALGTYSFAVKGWGEAQLEVKGWHRGGMNRPGLQFIKHKKCVWLVLVSN